MKMKELDHVGLRYRGVAGEAVNITVEPQPPNMVWLISYTLDEQPPRALKKGESISFVLKKKPGGEPTVLSLLMDSAEPGGNYHVVLRTVTNESGNQCVNDYPAPPLISADYIFFVS
jgi:hypothetical protein